MQRLALCEIPWAIHYDSYFHRIYITLGTTRNLETTSTDERMWWLACKCVPFLIRTWEFRDFDIHGGVMEQIPWRLARALCTIWESAQVLCTSEGNTVACFIPVIDSMGHDAKCISDGGSWSNKSLSRTCFMIGSSVNICWLNDWMDEKERASQWGSKQRAQSLWQTEAEGTGWRQTYLLSFLFICWPRSQVRTFSNHFCDGERKSGPRATHCSLPQPHPLSLALVV